MGFTDDLQRQLMSTFRAEVEDHLGTLNKNLLALEKGPEDGARQALLSELFRSAHSLKGAARAVAMKDIEVTAHHLEDALGIIQKENLAPGQAHIDALLGLVDAIRDIMLANFKGEQVKAVYLEGLYAQLTAAMQGKTIIAVPPQPAPPEPQKPVPQKIVPDKAPPQPDIPVSRQAPQIITDETIRVSVAKLDSLMDNLGELLVARMRADQLLEEVHVLQQRAARQQKNWRRVQNQFNRVRRGVNQPRVPNEPLSHSGKSLSDLPVLVDFLSQNGKDLKSFEKELHSLASQVANDRNHLQLVTETLQNGIRRARMLPISNLFEFFPRMVRDLAMERGKDIYFQMDGGETEVDRQTQEWMRDPLIHLLRNAIDHGIEPPDQRAAAGKPVKGTIRLMAEQRGSNLVITVSDDGRGIDIRSLKQIATEIGIKPPAEIAAMSDEEAIRLIFHSGLSTARQVTAISGRGVGLDVVRANLEQIHGLVQVQSAASQGTTFILTLPLTLTTSHVLLARSGGQVLALPMINVERILRVKANQIGSIDGRPAIYSAGRPLLLISLAQTLGLPETDLPIQPETNLQVVVLGVVEKQVALRVDSFLSTQEVVVKGLGRQLRRVRNLAGATILGNGQLVMVLNVADLMRSIQDIPAGAVNAPKLTPRQQKHKILVVDDSITTRMLEKHILENAGYQVEVAANGQQAWERLQNSEQGTPDLVVSDVNMPEMDGFTLAESIKHDAELSHLPIFLITSLDSPQEKIRGLEAGADAYIVKSSFDQRELLEMIERFL